MPGRTPDEITETIDDLLMGRDDHDTDVWSCIWEIIEDILDSMKLAESKNIMHTTVNYESIHTTVQQYVINHYGDVLTGG